MKDSILNLSIIFTQTYVNEELLSQLFFMLLQSILLWTHLMMDNKNLSN